MKRVIATLLMLLFFGSISSQMNMSGQLSYMHFLGDTKLKHFGGGLKGEFEYNEWVGIYGGFNLYSKADYTGIVYAEAWGPGTQPEVAEIPTPSSVFFMQGFVGTRIYFHGGLEADARGGFGAYGIGELSLLFGQAKSVVSSEGYDVAYNVPITGNVKGSFINYVGSIGVGIEKPLKKIMLFADAKFNIRINEANTYTVTTIIPFGFSYFMGVRYSFAAY